MRSHIILILVTLMWGINPPIMKLGLLYVPSLSYNVARLLIAFILGVFICCYLKIWQPFSTKSFAALMVSSLGFCIFQVFFTYGVKLTSAGNASLIIGCLPISIAIINHLHHIEKINKIVFIAILLSLSGVVIMVLGSGKSFDLASEHIIGAIMLIVAQFGYGYYTVFSKPLMKFYSPYQIAVYILFVSTIVFLCISVPQMVNTNWSEINNIGWGSILYSAVFPLCLANCLWISSIEKVGSTVAAMYNNLSPFFAIVTAYFLLGEKFSFIQFIGAILIILSLYIVKKSNNLHKQAINIKI